MHVMKFPGSSLIFLFFYEYPWRILGTRLQVFFCCRRINLHVLYHLVSYPTCTLSSPCIRHAHDDFYQAPHFFSVSIIEKVRGVWVYTRVGFCDCCGRLKFHVLYLNVLCHLVPNPMITINSNPPPPILDGTDVTLTCNVTMGQGVLPSDLSLLMVDTQLSRDGTILDLTGPVVSGTTFTYTTQLNSFGRNDSGIYAYTANVS